MSSRAFSERRESAGQGLPAELACGRRPGWGSRLGRGVCVGRKHLVGLRLAVTGLKDGNLFSFAFLTVFSHLGAGPVLRVRTPLGVLGQVPGSWLLNWLIAASGGTLKGAFRGFSQLARPTPGGEVLQKSELTTESAFSSALSVSLLGRGPWPMFFGNLLSPAKVVALSWALGAALCAGPLSPPAWCHP